MRCPICENSKDELIIKSFFSRFYYCQICNCHFLPEPLKANYPEEYFKEKTESSIVAKLIAPLLSFFYILRIRKIKKLLGDKSSPKVLDYGCGDGKLVEALIKKGVNAVGFEPSEGARKITATKNLPVYGEIISSEENYDLIMFWHSLEHIAKPFEVIKKMRNYLKKDGKLLIAAPNADSPEAYIARGKWFHYSYPFHCIHFTPKAISILLKKSGLQIDKIDYFNPEYTVSGLSQTFLNLFLPENVLYSVVSHRRLSMSFGKAVSISFISLFSLLLFFPLLAAMFLIELISAKTDAMIVVAKNENV